jgi:hypothetical protein
MIRIKSVVFVLAMTMLKSPLTRSEFDRLAGAYKKLREKDAAAGKL